MKRIFLFLFLFVSAHHIIAQPCSGLPVAGAAVASANLICGTSTITVNDTGCSTGSGIAYQWQYSSDNFTWINLVGGNTNPYSFTPTDAYYYRCVVTCTNSCLSSFSGSAFVGFEPSCPCVPTYHSAGCSYVMVTFRLAGSGGTSINDPAGCAVYGYIDRTSIVAPITLRQGGSYAGTTYMANPYWFNEGQAWIDFNNDGIFSPSEAVTTVFGTPSIFQDSINIILNVPVNAPGGFHRMRIRQVSTYEESTLSSAIDPCNMEDADSLDIYQEGNAFDYIVQIISPFTGATNLCAGDTTTLSASIAGGIWSSGNATVATVNAATGFVTGISAGTTMISYIAGTDTSMGSVSVYPLPIISIMPGPTTICLDSSVQLFASGASVYTWHPNAGLSCTSACDTCSSPIASPASTTDYYVIGATSFGCIDSAHVSVTVDTCTTTTGIKKQNYTGPSNIEYPNPVTT